MIKLSQVEMLLLFHVFMKTRKTKSPYEPTIGELRSLMSSYEIGGGDIDSAASELSRDNRLSFFNSMKKSYYKISAAGIRVIEVELANQSGELHSALKSYQPRYESFLSELDLIPASDRIISLDHNSQSYKDAVSKLDETIAAVQSANDIGGATPEEKESAVAELGAVRRMLDAAKVRAVALLRIATPVFEWIAKTFTQEGLKRLAGEAFDLLKGLL